MPTILIDGPYRFFFFSRENREPPHIHVERDDAYAKIWLEPVVLAHARGLRSHELTEVLRITAVNRELFLRRWHEHLNR